MSTTSSDRLQQFDLTRLPPAPYTLIDLLKLFDHDEVDFIALAKVIETDAGLSARILSMADSASLLQWNGALDIERLVVIIGQKTLRQIILTSAVQDYFSHLIPVESESLSKFWQQSLLSGILARKLATLCRHEAKEELYLFGLLSQMGCLCFLMQEHPDYPQHLINSNSHQDLIPIERELFGMSSAELGARVIEKWIPDCKYGDWLRFQNSRGHLLQDTQTPIKIMNLAVQLATSSQLDTETVHKGQQLFSLSESLLEGVLNEAIAELSKIATTYQIKFSDRKVSDLYRVNEDQQIVIAQKIRELALLQGMSETLAGADEMASFISTLFQQLQLLFSISHSALFLFNREKEQLTGISASKERTIPISRVKLPLITGRSLLSDALLQRKIITTFDQKELSVVDRQICRYLYHKALLVLPLTHKQQPLGVLVCGIGASQYAHYLRQKSLYRGFSTAVTASLLRLQNQQKQMQQQLTDERQQIELRARKMVHEANNPLAIIKNYLAILVMQLDRDNPAQEQIEQIKEEINRVTQIVTQMRQIAAPDKGINHSDSIELNSVLRRQIDLFSSGLLKINAVNVTFTPDSDISSLEIDKNHLLQIMTNLIKNAAEAMTGGGELTITTRNAVIFEGETYIEIEVQDNGPGIPISLQQKIFSPIVSSKGGDHSGLGLAITHQLVKEMQGLIQYRSSKKEGTRFTLLFPKKI